MRETALDTRSCPDHNEQSDWLPPLVHSTYKWTPGRDTGIYKLDYGLYATHDLTNPEKHERLKKDGRWSESTVTEL